MSYFLAASLVKLRDEVNALWPNRSKVSDGWIGDAAHSARKSDHNPDWSAPGRRRGVVRALDITTRGIDVDRLLRHTTNDSRVAYVIYNRRIYTHSRGWYAYNGSNPHTNHVHVSIAHTNTAENDLKAWIRSASGATSTASTTKPVAKPKPKPKPSASKGKGYPHTALPVTNAHTTASHNAWVYLMRHAVNRTDRNLTINIQRWLRDLGYYKGRVDGVFGPVTVRALQTFLRAKGLYKGRIDGQRGPMTIRAEIAYLNQQRRYF